MAGVCSGVVAAREAGAARVVVSHPDSQTTGDFCRDYFTGDVVFR
jgi:hypothetical protein